MSAGGRVRGRGMRRAMQAVRSQGARDPADRVGGEGLEAARASMVGEITKRARVTEPELPVPERDSLLGASWLASLCAKRSPATAAYAAAVPAGGSNGLPPRSRPR
jgi:hypothetical protein